MTMKMKGDSMFECIRKDKGGSDGAVNRIRILKCELWRIKKRIDKAKQGNIEKSLDIENWLFRFRMIFSAWPAQKNNKEVWQM